MSKLPIFEHFLSVGNLKPKLKWFFKPKLKPKMFQLNWAPAPTFDFDYEVGGGDYEYPADAPSSGPDEEHDEEEEVHPGKGICDIVGSRRSGKYAFTHLRGELFLFHGKAS